MQKKKKQPKKHVAVLERAQSAEGISHGEKPHETLKGQIEFNTRKNKQNDYQQASQELLCPSISGMETEASVWWFCNLLWQLVYTKHC